MGAQITGPRALRAKSGRTSTAPRRRSAPPAASPRPSIPLSFRLPNPPPLFIGREAEVERLAQAIERAPVSLVWGLGGLGKTALVLHTLHTRFPDRVKDTLFVPLREGMAGAQVLVEVVRAITHVCGRAPLDWSSLHLQSDIALATAIDLADEARLWVVLDDLHHGEPSLVSALVANLARYGRAARWIGTSREDPGLPEVAEQVLSLGAMNDDALLTLADRCGAGRDSSSVHVAAGSPWRLRQALAGTAMETRLLPSAPEAARPLLSILALFDAPLPRDVAGRLAPIPERAVLDALEARGFLQSSADGWRLHDVARQLLRAESIEEARGPLGLAACAALDDDALAPSLHLEALRLHLEGSRWSEAARLLDQRRVALFAAGYVRSIWHLLEPLRAPELARARLQCALELDDPRALAKLDPMGDDDPEATLLWARALFARGEVRVAMDAAGALERDAATEGRPDLRFEAGLLLARGFVVLWKIDEARRTLEELAPPDDDARAHRDALLAYERLAAGAFDEALALSRKVAALYPHLGRGTRRQVGDLLVEVLLFLGRLREAEPILDAQCGGHPPAPVSVIDWLGCVMLATASGRLELSRALLQNAAGLAERSAPVRAALDGFSLRRRLSAGDLQDIDAEITRLLADSLEARNPQRHHAALLARTRLAVLRAEPSVDVTWPESLPPLLPLHGAQLAQAALLQAVRRDAAGKVATPPAPAVPPGPIEERAIQLLVEAQSALLQGDDGRAFEAAQGAERLAREEAWGPLEADAQIVLADLALRFERPTM
ncbi:MAG TPA: hypothetical protein VGI39_33470, partial [Polyangiaceae bacterium]